MARYDYQRPDGMVFEVVAPMSAEKPERIWVEDPTNPESSWRAATAQDPADQVFGRIFACRMSRPVVEDYSIDWGKGKLPVSHSMSARQDPYELVKRGGYTVRRHADGTFSDTRGRPIVTSKRDSDRHCAATGCQRVKKTDL